MDFGHFDVDAYLQLQLDNANVPTAPVALMVPTSPMAAVLPATSPSVDTLYDDLNDYYGATTPDIPELDWLPHDAIELIGLNQGDDLYHPDDDLHHYGETAPEIPEPDWLPHDAIEPIGLNQGDDLYHQGDDLHHYGETAPEIPELDWLAHDAIEPTVLNRPSIAVRDAFVQANLDDLAPDDLTDQLTSEANEPHTPDVQTQVCMSQEDSFGTKEDNHSENRAAIIGLRSLVLEEFGILRAERAATKDQMNKIMAAIAKYNTFTEETPVLMQMLSEELKTLVPIASTGKISMFQDVIFPSSYYFQDDISEFNASWDCGKRRSMRGNGTGRHWHDGSWRNGHRQRLVHLANSPN
ncbi:hypothetical protein VE02_03934 [Pseudogymnoascus sp. 03VT05]|nr:hypothetical protein VE02_03934 [Pseudogymnoascus sp. 03VT05]